MSSLKIIWTKTAKEQLKSIFYIHSNYSVQSAKNLKDEILKTSKEIRFFEQYQIDEIESEFRRFFVKDYKILYSQLDGVVFIARIFNTKQEPTKQL